VCVMSSYEDSVHHVPAVRYIGLYINGWHAIRYIGLYIIGWHVRWYFKRLNDDEDFSC
jgi:hypothetical protein